MPNRCYINLSDAWEELARVRSEIENYFARCSEDLRSAATMAGLELAENVLKHGAEPVSGLVTLSAESGEMVITTQNRAVSTQSAQAVCERIKYINENSARELYVARMLKVLDTPEDGDSGLGLLRIAYEGAFHLSCEIMGDRLQIHAKRRVEDAIPN